MSKPLFHQCLVLLCALIAPGSADEVVRIMAANTTSGNFQSYDPGEGIRIFQGLDPDIVLIQEFNFGDDSTSAIRGFVDTAFGTEFQYTREPGNEQIPNGVISRYPILQSGEWVDNEVSNRDFSWAQIDIPGDKNLWAVSVHFLTTSASNRQAQATALRDFITANVPATDYLVVGGDFNTDNFSESALSTLSAVVETGGRPDDQNGTTGTNASRSKPYDQVLPGPDLDVVETPVVVSGHSFTYNEGLVFDSRVFTPLSAVSPVLSSDSGASGMQHMAVIRDFLIPVTGGATEPADYPTNFAGSSTTNSISLSWTDVASIPVPNGYLIKASSNPVITPPTDGITESDDTDLSDGSAQVSITNGIEAASFTGLPADTTYYFEIYPYTNTGTIDYKTDGSVPTAAIATMPESGNPPSAPLLASSYYVHATGFTATWNKSTGATGYRLDVSESPTFTGASGSTILSENFDSSTSVPAGWINSGSANQSNSVHYNSAPNCRAMGPNDTVETPSVDFPAELSFYVDSSNGGNGQDGSVSYSINGGTWQTLSTFTVSTSGNIETIDLTSSPDLTTESNVRFRFESTFFTWYLDDVEVAGAAGPGFVSGYEDLAVGNACYFPVAGLDPNTDYYFRVRAENLDGASPNSSSGMITTTSNGTPYSAWASDQGVAPADFLSNFDGDELLDFEEYLLASDPGDSASAPEWHNISLQGTSVQVIHRRSLAPKMTWDYLGGTTLPLSETPLAEGSGYHEYQIISVQRLGDYDLVTLTIDVGPDDQFFFSIRVTQAP